MGLLIDDPCFELTHVLYKTALAFALLRWALSWAWRVKDAVTLWHTEPILHSLPTTQMIKERLGVSSFCDVVERLPHVCDSCAICLGPMGGSDQVRELRNCCHVYHRDCIDRWVDHDDQGDANQKSCPLCRAPLLVSFDGPDCDHWTESEPESGWAVERILYLFGDDL